MKKLIRRYVFYAFVVALIYMVTPLFFQGDYQKLDFLEYRFLFPATALVSGMIFSWKKGLDFTFPLFPPIIYIVSSLVHSHEYNRFIYTFVYLILAMLGCFIGDMVYRSESGKKHPSRREEFENTHRITYTEITVESVEEFEEKDE